MCEYLNSKNVRCITQKESFTFFPSLVSTFSIHFVVVVFVDNISFRIISNFSSIFCLWAKDNMTPAIRRKCKQHLFLRLCGLDEITLHTSSLLVTHWKAYQQTYQIARMNPGMFARIWFLKNPDFLKFFR